MVQRSLDQRRQRSAALGTLLESSSYARVLDRGFAVVLNDAGDLVRAPVQVQPGEPLTVRLAEGDLGVAVSGAPARRRRRSSSPTPDGQESLF